ncbi:MAG: hypothetical protein ACK5Y2_08785 [Bdellovibrionales bacterium]
MKLKSEFDLSLDFQPLRPWPSCLPGVALGRYLVAGFGLSDQHPVVEHALRSTLENTDLFLTLYPDLQLVELLRLFQKPSLNSVLDLGRLLENFGWQDSDDARRGLAVLATTSLEFQTWATQKKLGYHEWLGLADLSQDQREFVTGEILLHQDNKNEGAQRLEWLSDLLQMGHEKARLQGLKLSDLRKLRFPESTSRDENLAQAPFSWPKSIRRTFNRRGDKGGFDIHFFAGTPIELTKTAQHLMKVAQEWTSNLDKNS